MIRTTRLFTMLLIALFLLATSYHGQAIAVESNDELSAKKDALLLDLRGLETMTMKLEKPLPQALAKTEIAGAAWPLDKTWAEKLLRDAYELTFPAEEGRARLRNQPVGAPLVVPTALDVARNNIRNRVLTIATRDQAFADQLAQLGAQQLGKAEARSNYTNLAAQAIRANNYDTAGDYILKAIDADPTVINTGFVILDVATQDRKAADQLIIQYIERLRTTPLTDDTAFRVFFNLQNLVFPSENFVRMGHLLTNNNDATRPPQPILPAGPAVIRAYVSYVLESLSQLEQREPGSVMNLRGFLLATWLPLRQYAPELTGKFMELERLSRRPGENVALPTPGSAKESTREDYEQRLKAALDSDRPDETIIYLAISHGDFAKARKLIAKLPDGGQKAQLTDEVNTREALSLAAKGDLPGAQRLAEQLTKATSMLQVYPTLIGVCSKNKDQACAAALVYQAMKQIKSADITPALPPAGLPAPSVATSREFDPILLSLNQLAKAMLPINESLAFVVLDEMVRAANASELDTGLGRTGFDADVFKQFAVHNEAHTRQAAETFKDPLRQIVALAAIYQQQAMQLAKQTEVSP